jgi:hypothetical protein
MVVGRGHEGGITFNFGRGASGLDGPRLYVGILLRKEEDNKIHEKMREKSIPN